MPLCVGAPHSPRLSPPEAPPRPSLDLFFLLQKLPTLSHKANASEINQLSILSDSICEIADSSRKCVVATFTGMYDAATKGHIENHPKQHS